jgi:hypothetical protein
MGQGLENRGVRQNSYFFGFWKFWISIFELARNSTPARNSGFENLEFRSSSWLDILLQLEIRVLKILNFDLRTGSKFNSSSKFNFWQFWISIFELAPNSTPAWNSGFWNFEFRSLSWFEIQLQLEIRVLKKFEFRSSSWLEIQLHLEIRVLKILNFDLWASSKFNSSSKFNFWKLWISILELARNSTPARNSALVYFEFRSSS